MKKTIFFTAFSLFLALFISTNSYAASYDYGFSLIPVTPSNGAIDISDQLYVSVEEGTGGALFTFHNVIGIDSTVTQIVFGDSTDIFSSIGIAGSSSTDVEFESVSGGGGYTFSATSLFGSQPNYGLDHEDDWVSFFGTYSTTPTSFNSLKTVIGGTLNIALHVQRIPLANGGNGDASDKYILTGGPIPGGFGGPDPVPLPAALWLFAPALLGFMGFRRKTKS